MAKSLAPPAKDSSRPCLSPPPRIWPQLDRRRQHQVAHLVAELIRRQLPPRDPPESSHEPSTS